MNVGDKGQLHTVEVKIGPMGVEVSPIWAGVDRPNTGGWIVKDQRTADRLALAISAGAAYKNPTVKVDNDGRTYVSGAEQVRGRCANADLKALGY